VQAVKVGKLEDRYENALGALLNQEGKREPVRTAVKPRDTGNVVNLMDALARARTTSARAAVKRRNSGVTSACLL
jgi:non-homologous end joining protein Ku